MANLNIGSAELSHPTVRGERPKATINADGTILFSSPLVFTKGIVELSGTANENVAGWKLGFFQLQFVETNYSTYRGRASAGGSTRVSGSHSRLCRDTDEGNPALWYDPEDFSSTDSRGLFRATTLPGTGRVEMKTGFGDAPTQSFDTEIQNTRTLMPNFLHHSDIAFHFCTMLVVEDPHHNFTVLKHFYWNIRWEAHFQTDASGRSQIARVDHFDLNIQRRVHSGIPDDSRFRNRVFDRNLPISNVLANRAHRRQFETNWSLA